MKNNYEIAVIGGGPAGSTVSTLLARTGFKVCLIEKKLFPREVLCGEFLSVEVSKILKSLNLFDDFLKLNPNPINALSLFFEDNKKVQASINFQAYALKRSIFDKFLLDAAIKTGVKVFQPYVVKNIYRQVGNYFLEAFDNNNIINISANTVIGAYGRTGILDKKLKRNFVGKHTLLNGLKFHISNNSLIDFNINEIRMYLSNGIYCGINAVNRKETTVCFLENRKSYKGSAKENLIELFFNKYKYSNPVHDVFRKEIFSLPVYGTGNIFFGRKKIIEDGIHMIGDAARVIAPLSGDGIGIAMESAVLLAEILKSKRDNKLTKKETEFLYINKWKSIFRKRLVTSSILQKIVLNTFTRKLAYNATSSNSTIINSLIKKTRSKQ